MKQAVENVTAKAIFEATDGLDQRLREIRGLTNVLAASLENEVAPPNDNDVQAVFCIITDLVQKAEALVRRIDEVRPRTGGVAQ